MTEQGVANLVFARIDAWWSEWLAALDAIADADKLTPGVCDEWSVKDLMAHTAVWDLHAAVTAERLAAGQERADDSFQAINDETSARDANLTLAEAHARMEDAHAGMLARLRKLGHLEPEWVAEDTFGHYPDHVDQLLAWSAEQLEIADAGLSPAEVIARVNDGWARWLEAIDGIDPDLIDEAGVCGSWSTKDLIGHIEVWDREAAACVRRETLGQTHPVFDWQRVNEAEAERLRTTQVSALIEQMQATHANLLIALGDAPNLEAGWIVADTYGHYPQHIAQIRAWRTWKGI